MNCGCCLQVEQKEAALASLQDQVTRAVEDGGQTRDRIAQMQAQLEEIRAGQTGGSPLGGAAEQLETPARATAVATETVCLRPRLCVSVKQAANSRLCVLRRCAMPDPVENCPNRRRLRWVMFCGELT